MNCPILRVGLSGFSPLDHYRLGQCIAQAVDALGRRAVFVASGDLSEGRTGFCRARACRNGIIVPLNYRKLTSMVNVLVTNGTIEEAPWRALLLLIDAVNIDLKVSLWSGISGWAAIWRQ